MKAGQRLVWPDGRSITILTACPPLTPWPASPTLDPAPGLRAIGASHDAAHDGYIVVALGGTRFGRPYRTGEAPVALEVWPYAIPPGAVLE